MQVDHGTFAVQPQAHAVARPMLTGDDLVYDQLFKTFIRQNMFSDSENASATCVSGVAQRLQAGGTAEKRNTAPEPTDPRELARYPQEWGHVPFGELEKSAKQQEPHVPYAYPNEQDDHMHNIPANQRNSSFQFAESAGVAMANTNFQNIPSSYQQSFTSPLRPPVPVQLSSNANISTAEQLQAFYESLPPHARENIGVLLLDAAVKRQAGTAGNPGMNGAYTPGAQPGEQAVYQPNLQWSQTGATDIPTAHPASRSQMYSEYTAIHAQAQAQAQVQNQVPLIPDALLSQPNYQSQQKEWKPTEVEYLERSYGITLRPEDYGIFPQGQNPRANINNMNTGYGQNPWTSGSYQAPLVPGSSKDGRALPETTPIKRKHEDEDEVMIPPTPARRRKVSSQKYIPEPPPSSPPPGSSGSPQADDDEVPVDLFFVPTKYGNKAGFCCRYEFPSNRGICNTFISGRDRRKRYRHLSTHAQYEESLVSSRHLDVADAVLLPKLPKLVVKCNIGGCDFRHEVWRTDHVREDHERSCHFDLYMGRVQEREHKRTRKSGEEVFQWQASEGNYQVVGQS